jgi:hypothetical protein
MKKNTGGVGAEKYLDFDGMAVRYVCDKRTIYRRIKLGILPRPHYHGTRFPRWDIAELDANDRRLAYERVPNVAVIAAIKAKKAKAAEKAKKPAKKPARKHTAAVEQHEEISF